MTPRTPIGGWPRDALGGSGGGHPRTVSRNTQSAFLSRSRKITRGRLVGCPPSRGAPSMPPYPPAKLLTPAKRGGGHGVDLAGVVDGGPPGCRLELEHAENPLAGSVVGVAALRVDGIPPRCRRCGGELPPPKPRGRPRLFCDRCRVLRAAEGRRRYKTEGPADRARREYNAKRRLEYAEAQREARQHVCPECGERFEGHATAIVCSRKCKTARHRRNHPEKWKAQRAGLQRRRRARRKAAAAIGGVLPDCGVKESDFSALRGKPAPHASFGISPIGLRTPGRAGS